MHQRCYCPGAISYRYYGGKGIAVCDRWHDYESFLADMGEPAPGMTIDRIDNSKGYEPENCRWATYVQQNRNRSNNRIFEFRGEKKTLAELSEICGLNRMTIRRRVEAGESLESAMFRRSREWKSQLAKCSERVPHD